MPGKKKVEWKIISVRIRPDQKEDIEAEKLRDFSATQDSIVRDALDEHFKKKGDK
jgi:hypothetical protein